MLPNTKLRLIKQTKWRPPNLLTRKRLTASINSWPNSAQHSTVKSSSPPSNSKPKSKTVKTSRNKTSQLLKSTWKPFRFIRTNSLSHKSQRTIMLSSNWMLFKTNKTSFWLIQALLPTLFCKVRKLLKI